MPVYVLQRIPKIVGVAAIDVLLSKISDDKQDSGAITKIFVKKPECQLGSPDSMALDYFRCKTKNSSDNCDSITAPFNLNQNNCDGNLSMDVFMSEGYDS
jgi:hypothetical protein